MKLKLSFGIFLLFALINLISAQTSTSQSTSRDYINGDLMDCPQYAPPAPGWCSNGTIVSQPKDAYGCDVPPKCIYISNNTSNNSSCQEGFKPFYYYDYWGEMHSRCLKDYRTEGGLITQDFFIKENPSFQISFISESEIDLDNSKLIIIDSNGAKYKPRLYVKKEFINSGGAREYRIRADLIENRSSLQAPIRLDYNLKNVKGEIVSGYKENIPSISILGLSCNKIFGSSNNEESLNLIFLSNGYNSSEFEDFDINMIQLVQQELLIAYPFNEFNNKINIHSIHNDKYVFACAADYLEGRFPCNNEDIITLIESTCNIPFSDNDLGLIYTSDKIKNSQYPSASGKFVILSSSGKTALAHETAHAFADFSDEYLTYANIFYDVYSPNLDVEGCPKWCNGVLNKSHYCYPFYMDWKECVSPFLSNWQSHMNELSICYQNISQLLGFPLKNCNLGQNCLEGTGCYFGSSSMLMFRSMQEDAMTGLYNGRHNFGPYSISYLRKKIVRSFQSGVSSSSILNSSSYYSDKQQTATSSTINQPSVSETGKISSQCDNGCEYNYSCIPVGYRLDNFYCDINKLLINQRESGIVCENNFECSSNLCVSGKCMSPNLIEKILNFFKRLFNSK